MALIWATLTAYGLGDQVVATTMGVRYYTCSGPGTSGVPDPFGAEENREKVTDGTVIWECHYLNDEQGNLKLSDGIDTLILIDEELDITPTIGSPDITLQKRGGSKASKQVPIMFDVWAHRIVFNIQGLLRGAGSYAEAYRFYSMWSKLLGSGSSANVVTLTFTGSWKTMFDPNNAGITTAFDGAGSLRLHRKVGDMRKVYVTIQLQVVDQ